MASFWRNVENSFLWFLTKNQILCVDFSIMSKNGSHRRFNPLLGEWIIVCRDRLNRPWKGAIEESPSETKNDDGNTNYLAPGGIRANGMKTPDYKNTFVFENDFPAFNKKEIEGFVENVIENVDDLFITQKSFGLLIYFFLIYDFFL